MKITRRSFFPLLSMPFLLLEKVTLFWRSAKNGLSSEFPPLVFNGPDGPKGYHGLRCFVHDMGVIMLSEDFHTFQAQIFALPLPFGAQGKKVISFQLPIEDRGVCIGDEIKVWFRHHEGSDYDDFVPVVENLTTGARLSTTSLFGYWEEFSQDSVVAYYRCPCGKTWWDYVLKSEMTAEEREADDAWWAEVKRRTREIIDAQKGLIEMPQYEELKKPDPKRERLCGRCSSRASQKLLQESSGPPGGRSFHGIPPRRTPMGRPLPLDTQIELK